MKNSTAAVDVPEGTLQDQRKRKSPILPQYKRTFSFQVERKIKTNLVFKALTNTKYLVN